jgi:hypothetical protein
MADWGALVPLTAPRVWAVPRGARGEKGAAVAAAAILSRLGRLVNGFPEGSPAQCSVLSRVDKDKSWGVALTH